MDYLGTLVVASSAYSGFTIGSLFYKFFHSHNTCPSTSINKLGMFETIYGLIGAGCFIATQQGFLNMYEKYKNKN